MAARTLTLLLFVFLFVPLAAQAETPADIQDLINRRQKQIAEIEEQISGYWESVDAKKAQGESVQGEIEIIKEKIARSELEIKSLNLGIEESRYRLRQTEGKIEVVSDKVEKMKMRLASALRILQQREETPMLLRFTEAGKLSEMFTTLTEVQQLHRSLRTVLSQLKGTRIELEEVRDTVVAEKNKQERLRRMEESQKEISVSRKNKKASLVNKLEKEKDKLIGTIVGKKRDLEKIKEQITYLEQAGVSAEQAVRLGELAAIRTGVRTSFLIAVLEVESRLGLNVGTGRYKKDMHPRDHKAFLEICKKLGLDPDETPVSRKPNYGWGGAMGPAQFIPNTWMAYESEVARLTGHNPPSPWNIEDAFTASALKLSRQGAAEGTRDGERRAAKAYIGGSPKCSKSICNYYANLVLEKAEEIEAELGS